MPLADSLRQITAPFARRLRHAVRPPSEAMRAGLELNEDSPLHLDWIVGAMAFLAALAMVGAVATMDAAAHWRRGLTGTLTVEIPAVLKPAKGPAGTVPAASAERLDRVLTILRREPGIESATPLAPARIAELLSPWLGSSDLIDSLPVPQLIDIRLSSDARLDVAGIRQRLAAAVAGTTLDDHQIWIAQLVHLARLAVGLALTIVGLVAASAVAAVVIATRASLAMHHAAIDLLHLMGAEDDYIAEQFASQALRRGLRGGLLGLLLAALALVVFGIASQTVDPKLLPRLWPELDQVVPLILVPLATAALGWLTARHTVRRALKQMV